MTPRLLRRCLWIELCALATRIFPAILSRCQHTHTHRHRPDGQWMSTLRGCRSIDFPASPHATNTRIGRPVIGLEFYKRFTLYRHIVWAPLCGYWKSGPPRVKLIHA
jgi:hypothetical protein